MLQSTGGEKCATGRLRMCTVWSDRCTTGCLCVCVRGPTDFVHRLRWQWVGDIWAYSPDWANVHTSTLPSRSRQTSLSFAVFWWPTFWWHVDCRGQVS